MIGMKITVQSKKLVRALRAIEGRIANPRVALKLAGVKGAAEVKRNFQKGCDKAGRAWKPLTPLTLALRPGGGGGGKTLLDTGALRASIRSGTRGPKSVLVYTKRRGAWAHQMGATIVPKKTRILARELSGAGLKTMLKAGLRGIRVSRNKITGKDYVVFGKKVRIPRRQFMFLTPAAQKVIADTVGDYLMKGAARA